MRRNVVLTEWRACRAIAAQTVQRQLHVGSLRLSYGLLAAGPISTLAIGALTGRWRFTYLLCMGIPLGAAALMWWVLFIGSVATQDASFVGQLAPNMRARLMRTTVLVWGVLSLALTLVLGIASAHPLTCFVLIGLAAIAVTIVLYLPWLAMVVAVACWSWSWMQVDILPVVSMQGVLSTLGSDEAALLGLALIAGAGWGVLRVLFGRHDRAALGEKIARWSRYFLQQRAGRVYASFLRRDCADGPRRPLFMHAIGPAGHWSSAMAPAAMCAMPIVFEYAWRARYGSADLSALRLSLRAQVGVLLALTPPMLLQGANLRLYATGTEQAVVRLAPGAPACARLNADLGRTLLHIYVVGWLGAVLVALGVSWCMGAAGEELARLLAVACFSLSLAPTLLRDYAGAPFTQLQWSAWLAPYAVLAGGLGLLTVTDRYLAGWWLLLAALAVAAAVIRLTVRWRRMCRAPVAFPAGRLA